MYNGVPLDPIPNGLSPSGSDYVNALFGARRSDTQTPETQALTNAIAGPQPPPVNTGAWPVPDAMASSDGMEPTIAPMGRKPWGMMTPEQGRAEVSGALPGYEQDVSAKAAEAEKARGLSSEAPALSFMGMPVMGAGEAQDATARNLAEAEAKKTHAEAQLAGEAALPTTTPLRNAAETAFQAAGASYASVPKFAGYIGGWLANEAGADIHPTDNAVFRLGDEADMWAKTAFPGDPARQDEFGTKAAHLTGFLATLYGAGGVKAMTEGGTELAAKIGDAVSKASQASLMAGTGGMGQFEGATRAMEAGQAKHPMAGVTLTPQGLPVSERDRAMATLLGAGVGLTTLVPMASALATAGERESGSILAEALKGSGVGAGQMAAFNVLNNAIAREYYDPNRPLTQGMEGSAELGALLGGATHGVAAAGAKRLSTPEEVKEFIEAARRSDPDPATADYWRGMHEMADEKLKQLPAPSAALAPEAEPGKLSEAGPYALRNAANWREEAHQRGVPGEETAPSAPETGTKAALHGVHATDRDFETFDPAKFGGRLNAGFWGKGVYMSPYEYIQNLGKEEGGTYYGERSIGISAKHLLLEHTPNKPFRVDHEVNEFGDIQNPKADWGSLKAHGWPYEKPPVMAWQDPKAMADARASISAEDTAAMLDAERVYNDAVDRMWAVSSKKNATPEEIEAAQREVGARNDEAQAASWKGRPEAVLVEKFTNALKDAGYDAVHVSQNGKPYEMLAIQPGTVKTAFGGEPMYALRGFHNPATRAVEESKQGSMPGDQWLRMLQGAGQKGVQKRHLEELGVPDFLAGKGKVTKGELLDHMRLNEAPLEEKIHEEPTPEELSFASKWDYVPVSQTPSDVLAKLENIRTKNPKFAGYSPFPNGRNNHEFVIRDPRFKGRYDEPHYEGPVALHIRTWDLDGPNGEKVLGVGEIQSTGHQKGRQEGYASAETEARIAEIKKEKEDVENRAVDLYHKSMEYGLTSEESEEYRSLVKKRVSLNLEAVEIGHRVPRMALSDSWLDVGMKRTLQYAAENGYDGVTWAKSGQIARAVGAEPDALSADYDKKIPSWFQKAAKKYGAGGGVVGIGGDVGPHNIDSFGLSDDAVRHIQSAEYDRNDAVYAANDELDDFRADGSPDEISHAENIVSEVKDFAKRELPTEANAFIRINDKMRDDIIQKGQPMALAPERAVRMMEEALSDGRPVAVSRAAMDEVHDSTAPLKFVVPEGTGIHALAKIEPRDDGRLLATFRDSAGNDIKLTADTLSDLTNLRGFCLNDGSDIFIPNFFASGGAAKGGPSGTGEVGAPDTHGGVFMHEAVHSLLRRGLIPADDWSRFVNHANSLQVLDMPMHEYLGAIGENVKPGQDTLRDNYRIAYQGYRKEDVVTLLNEEEPVAHMVELFHHGHFKGKQMQPIADLLQKFVGGEYAKRAPVETRPLEDIQGELEGKVKALYAKEFPEKDAEDFGTHGWWALGEGKSSYGDKDVLNRVREKHPDIVDKYRNSYKASREARLSDALGELSQ
jgi:hypothetical protein